MSYSRKKVLLTVKAYPEKSKKYGACVCTAGITDDGQFIRLYPIPFEKFRGKNRLPKYSWISVECEKASEYLQRKESYHVRYESIKILESLDTGPRQTWQKKTKVVNPMVSRSMEALNDLGNKDKTSLGLIKPYEIYDLIIDDKGDSTPEEIEIRKEIQITLDGEVRTDLEPIGYNFRYHFRCQDESCNGHNIMCEDWEMLEAWRAWKQRYPDRDTLIKMFKKRFLEDMRERDIHFFVGIHSRFNTWLIIGLYYPPKPSN